LGKEAAGDTAEEEGGNKEGMLASAMSVVCCLTFLRMEKEKGSLLALFCSVHL
jgi:hypothetical protein